MPINPETDSNKQTNQSTSSNNRNVNQSSNNNIFPAGPITAAPPGRLQASDFPIQNLNLTFPTSTTPSFGGSERDRPKLNRQSSSSSNHSNSNSAISLSSSTGTGHQADLENDTESNWNSDHGLEEVEEVEEDEQEQVTVAASGERDMERGRGRKRIENDRSEEAGDHSNGTDTEDKKDLLTDTRHLLEDAASLFDPNAYLRAQAWEEESIAGGNSSSFSRLAGTSIHSQAGLRFASDSRSRSRQRDEESQLESGGGMSATDDDGIITEDEEDLSNLGPGTSLIGRGPFKKRTWSRGGISNVSSRRNYGSTLSFTPFHQTQNGSMMQESHHSSHPYSNSHHHPSTSHLNLHGSDLPLESSITLREALVSHSTNPGSNLGLILIAISQLGYSFMNLFVKLLDEREGTGSKPEDRSSKDGGPLGALEIVATECFIMWLGCVFAMKLAKTEHM